MDKLKKVAVVWVIILSFIVATLFVFGPKEAPSFSWEVTVDDEFEFIATASGFIESAPFGTVEPIVLSRIANTSIVAKIVYLPTRNIESEDSLLDVVLVNKVSTRFSNGSSIPANISSTLNKLISRFFMPIGAWDYLDSLFPDTPEDAGQHEFGCDTYLSRLENQTFYFGYRHFNVDAGDWWYGSVSCSNGTPLTITTASSSYHPPYVFYQWTFTLKLIVI